MTSLASRLFRTRRRVADSTQPPKTVAVTVPDAPRASLNDDDELDHIVYNAQDYERSQLARMVFIILIPTLTLVSLSVVIVVSSLARQSTSEYAHSGFTRSIQLAALINTLQVERGLTAMQLGRYRDLHLPGGAHLDDAGARRLADARRWVDANLAPIDECVRVSVDGAVLVGRTQLQRYLKVHRETVLHTAEESSAINANIDFYTNVTFGLFDSMTGAIDIERIQVTWSKYIAWRSLIQAVDATGIQRALGSSFFSGCFMSTFNREWFTVLRATSDTFLAIGRQYHRALDGPTARNLTRARSRLNDCSMKNYLVLNMALL